MSKDKLQKSESQAVVTWEEQLAEMANVAAGMEVNVGGQFFSLKSGVLSWNDAPLPDNQMFVVILDAIMENVYYAGKFDATVPQSPLCFAFGRDEATMKPHEVVVKAKTAQCALCVNCEHNEWGSSDVGRGKACRNTRRLAMIAAGQVDSATKQFNLLSKDDFINTPVGFMKLPVTSVKGYSTYVKQVAAVLKRPPFTIATKVRVVPDPKSQFRVIFEPLLSLPDELLSVMIKRNKDTASIIEFPYSLFEDLEKPPQKSRGARKY
jgi:hypothetical protein